MANQISSRTQSLAHRLHANAIHLLRAVRREDAGSGLNAPRLSALSVVVFAGPLTLGELAAAEQVRPPTMTRIVHALESEGLVGKRKDPKDARLIQIRATARGRKLLMQARERRVRALAARIVLLPAGKQETLLASAQILEDVVRAV